MAPTRNERIEQLLKKKEELERKLKAEKALASKEERKKRTRELIELGGLAKIAFPQEIDKGTLLGLLLWSADIFDKPEASRNQWERENSLRWKQRGDAEIAKREAAKVARKGGKNETV